MTTDINDIKIDFEQLSLEDKPNFLLWAEEKLARQVYEDITNNHPFLIMGWAIFGTKWSYTEAFTYWKSYWREHCYAGPVFFNLFVEYI